MNIAHLQPAPPCSDRFHRSRERFIPEKPGCYVLTTFENEVIYVGLSRNLRSRFNQHLDSEQKTGVTVVGRAIFFSWLQTDDINKVERTWMNIHIQREGALPLLNKVYSPTFT
jgi:hypothetical protein